VVRADRRPGCIRGCRRPPVDPVEAVPAEAAARSVPAGGIQSNRLETLFLAVRFFDRLAHQRGDRDDADIAGRTFTAVVGWIESVITSSLSLELAMRAAAPPESTPWVM
jgi:hypothetical protein